MPLEESVAIRYCLGCRINCEMAKAMTEVSLLFLITFLALSDKSFVTIKVGFVSRSPGQRYCSKWSSLNP